MSLRTTLLPSLLVPLAAGLLGGCLEHPIKKVSYDKSIVKGETVSVEINKDVDILFVIDNSGSMAEEQALLSKNFESFISVLEQKDVNANYRIGLTTTDNGNPRCPTAQYTPEGGKLVLSSCVDRAMQGEFSFNMQDFSYACTDYCTLSDADLAIKETETELSKGKKEARKWIERIEGTTNLPDGVSTTQAFQCFGPQGVAGCGFESHLESMYRALAQTSNEQSTTNYGFLRERAILSVVFVSDETDCSYTDIGKDIFTSNKIFWNDPSDPAPTSAICWRAGVECEGNSPYAACRSSNYDLEGNPGAPDDQAVLHPVSRYVEFVSGIEAQKQVVVANQQVLIAAVAGVPDGYEKGDVDVVYEDSDDPDFQDDFGIGAGCRLPGMNGAPDQTAIPPVREREFAEAFEVDGKRNLFSICKDDYSGALTAIADTIRTQIKPACMPRCVRDLDPSSDLLDPSCTVAEVNTAAGSYHEVVPCEEVNGEWQAPAGETVCIVELIDRDNLTPSLLDDMSDECRDEGFNLEFKLIRSAAAPAGTTIEATCELSPNKATDCPLL